MFSGLSAFPLTPINKSIIDKAAFVGLIRRLVDAKVQSISVLGSTGCYAYFSRKERSLVTRRAVANAQNIPVIVGISALCTNDVITLANDAQEVGAKGLLLAPMSYQKLTDDEVFTHYETISKYISLPLCIYENPSTTNFEFSDELYGRITELNNVSSIKIPPLPNNIEQAKARINNLRKFLPAHVSIGISGDHSGAIGLISGCDIWYSALAGILPEPILTIVEASKNGQYNEVIRLSAKLDPLWELFRQHGSLRVIATIAEIIGLAETPCLPFPLKSLNGIARENIEILLKSLLLF